AYFKYARHASGRSVREQIWARWRLFHLPVFLLMVGAAILHVVAVWDMASPVSAGTVPFRVSEAAPAAPPRAGRPDVRKVTTIVVTPPGSPSPSEPAAQPTTPDAKSVPAGQRPPIIRGPERAPSPI